MDTTTGIIILLFVVTIFSSFGGNKGYIRPTAPPPGFSQPALPISKSNIDPTYLAVVGENARSSIQNYICRFRKPGEAVAITDSIMRYSQKFDINPKLIAALMRRESGFNPRATSSAGAMGLGQLLSSTCKSTGVTNPYDIDDNTKGTVRYMKYLLGRFKKYSDRVSFALAGYLEGPNAVARKQGYKSHTAAYIKDIIEIYHKI